MSKRIFASNTFTQIAPDADQTALENDFLIKHIFEKAPAIVFLFDLNERKITYINHTVEAYLGFGGHEIIAMQDQVIERLIHPDDREEMHEILRNFKTDPRHVAHIQCRVKTSDDNYRHFSLHASAYETTSDRGVKSSLNFAIDITAEKEALAELTKSEKLRQEAEKVAHIGSWELSADMQHAVWSDEVRAIVGIDKETVVGPSFLKNIIHPDYWEEVESSLISTVTEGTPHHLHYPIYRVDTGEMRWIECSARRYLDPVTGAYKLIGTGQDITDKIHTQMMLKNSKEELQSILNNLKDVFYRLDNEGKVIYVTPSVESLLGFTKEEVIGREMLFFYRHPEQREQVLSQIASNANIGKKVPVEVNFRHKNGTYGWVSVYAYPWYHSDGTVGGLEGLARDITREKELRDRLQKQEAKYRSIFDTSPVGIVYFTAEGIVDDCNEKAVEIFGTTKSEFIGVNLLQVLVDERLKGAVIETLERGESSFEGLYTSVLGQKTTFLRIQLRAIRDAGGRITAGVGLVEDISVQKEMENELQWNETRLKEAQAIAQLGSWELDLKENSLWWSDEIFRIFEIDPARFSATYEGFLEVIHPDDRERVDRAYRESVQNRLPYDIVHRLKMNDGRIKYVREVCTTYYESDGKPIRSIGTVQDITQLHTAQLSLREREQFLDAVVEHIPHVLFVKDAESLKYLRVNHALETLFGIDASQIVGKSDYDFFPPEVAEFNLRKDRETLRSRYIVDIPEETIDTGAHGLRTFRTKKIPIKDNSGRPRYLLGLAEDITDRKRHEHRMRQFATIIKNTSEGAMITDSHNRIVTVNPAFTRITGYSEEEVLGKNPSILRSGRQPVSFYDALWSQLNVEGEWQGEIENRRKNGEIYPEWLNITTIRNNAGEIENYIGIFTDITKLKASQEQLRYQALHDPLTGVPNRLMLSATLEHIIDRAKREEHSVALLFLDLDNFKNINDTAGHLVGDRVLKTCVKRIQKQFRRDDLLARFGGDEFVMILEYVTSPIEVALQAQRLLKLFREPVTIDQNNYYITLSIGISVFPNDGGDIDALIKSADTAMYRAKREGKNQYMFYAPDFTEELMEEMTIETCMRESIVKKEFELYYQPQVDMSNGTVIGFEALVRWHHPEHGLITPDRFIPVAEKSRLIVPLGAWILNEACMQAAAWVEAGLLGEGRIAVNVSGIQVEASDFILTLKEALQRSGLDPKHLELEITESVLMRNPDRWITLLGRIREMGIKIAIDDFGTGYSSLAYLRQFPLNKLKIDKSFVDDIPGNPDACSIAEAVVALANSLGLSTLAEGVETEEQANFLLSLGCQNAQGYLYAKPLTATDAQKRLKRSV